MGALVTRLCAVVFALYLLFGQRWTIGASTGGRGTVSVLELMFVTAAVGMWVFGGLAAGRPRAPRLLSITAGPFFVLLVAFPLLGVIVGGYDTRTLYSVIVVAVPLAVLALAATATRYSVDVRRWVFLAILGHGAYGVAQQMYRLGVLPPGVWGWAASWDIRSQEAYDDLYILTGRSTGLFINPNAFGLWSVLAVLFGALFLRGTPRVVAIALGLLGVLGSQSRTAWLAAALLGLAYAMTFLRSSKVARTGLGVGVVLLPVGLLLWLSGALGRLVEEGALQRLGSGIAGLTEGSSADANLAGRYEGWARAREFAAEYTVGTLGPPQVEFGGSIDNQFVAYYVQGGPLLVAGFAFALLSPVLVLRGRLPGWWKVALMSGVIALSSYTGNPIDSPATGALAWLAAGLLVHEAVRDGVLRSNRSPLPRTRVSPRAAGERVGA
ncbi:MAG: hypothetical protein IE926_04785 [Micrococcales bacterium]|nr:hypothetical protein [Micrococcales bacterium]